MNRTARTWALFAGCALLPVAALSWVSGLALRLERQESDAREAMRVQETLRLALWRMDSALAPFIARESARPFSHFAPLYCENLAFNRQVSKLEPAEALVPSPLLRERLDFILLHFEADPRGSFSSPQAPPEPYCGDFLANDVTTEGEMSAAQARLKQLSLLVTPRSLYEEIERAGAKGNANPSTIAGAAVQTAADYNVRHENALRVREWGNYVPQQALQREGSSPQAQFLQRPREAPVEQGGLQPLWVAGKGGPSQLLFVRRVKTAKSQTVQGIWIDWPKLQAYLLDQVRDILPCAELIPVPECTPPPVDRLLANVPAVLVAGEAPMAAVRAITPARAALSLAWAAMLAAIAAVGLVLRASLDLGERRGQFVSAVTHELRTPLTTFRLYSQMLADGIVTDPKTRREYIEALRDESDRLSRVVESVLLYSRVEDGASAARIESIDAGALLDGAVRDLEPLAERAGWKLQAAYEESRAVDVRADAQAVEQILRNLLENSLKYAAGAADKRLVLEARPRHGVLEVLYRDHGPGIPPGEERKIFEPFRRAPQHAKGAMGGIGLGLTLARGMARRMGGDLQFVRGEGRGAAFCLTLPVALNG